MNVSLCAALSSDGAAGSLKASKLVDQTISFRLPSGKGALYSTYRASSRGF